MKGTPSAFARANPTVDFLREHSASEQSSKDSKAEAATFEARSQPR